jgi:hypothetical protein
MKLVVKDPIKINHPMANKISVQNGEHHYAGVNTSELAFFMNNKWVTEIIPEFADYAEAWAGDTRVYGWVPNELVERFLENYAA